MIPKHHDYDLRSAALPYPRSLSELLAKWPTDDTQSLESLLPQVYDELRQLAHRTLRHQSPGHTLQSTALVHEAYLRLANQDSLMFENERQFFGLAALIMRQILVDYARKRSTAKRDGGARMPLADSLSILDGKSVEMVALDDALTDLARLNLQQSRIVELRFFGGLSIEETADVLEVSPATVKRQWSTARAFLHREMARAAVMMTPERWHRISEILEQALELAPEKRPRFLDVACSSDPELRSEVQSFLSAHETSSPGFLDRPPVRSSLFVPGTKLGDYEIVSQLGEGGMGVVYRARDLRLERPVAIKVIREHVLADGSRLRRFEQEAQAAAALNHPNILAVHQFGAYQGAPYLVSELLEGETLREELKRGPLSQTRAAELAEQIADGLSAAHHRGVVHRDLKPENLFVSKEQRVKILDFGLAKLLEKGPEGLEAAGEFQTNPGMVGGTVGYASPEQLRGEKLDAADRLVFARGGYVRDGDGSKTVCRGVVRIDV